MTSPSPGYSGCLGGVAAVLASSAWAVGTVIEQWNGKVWKLVRTPAGELRGVAATSVRNAWGGRLSPITKLSSEGRAAIT